MARSEAARESSHVREPLVDWKFTEEAPQEKQLLKSPPENAPWISVTIPHVFRQSGLPDETAGWYRHVLAPGKMDSGFSYYLFLDGAASVKDVFVNGKAIGQHKGAFSRSAFDLTPAIQYGRENTIDVRVSNRFEEAQGCFSRSTLYYVNGGMFRTSWLVRTGRVHIFPEMGSTGVYLTPKHITKDKADLEMQAAVRNTLLRPASVKVRFSVTGPEGKACGEFVKEETLSAGSTATVGTTGQIAHPQLWNLKAPNLYTVRTQIELDGQITDEVLERTGFRTCEWKDSRFYLNGCEVQFRGVNKHEQTEHAWNAVPDEESRGEWRQMIDMGVNAVRLAHYPHSQLEYDIADENGIAVWAENGYAGQSWKGAGNEEQTVTSDGERLTREMVRQNWNHPSILFWSAGNETIVDVVSHYASVIREEDRDRLRLIAYAANGKSPKNCDFVANNTYDGWYSGHYSKFASLPRNAVVSETGCGSWITHHLPHGTHQWKVDQFESEEYAGMFTEYRLQTICRDDFANRPMFFWWNFREFYNLKFKQNRNTKGLVTLAGAPKDLYYLFQVFLHPQERIVRLCGREHFLRTFAPDDGIKAYANASQLQLTLNGIVIGKLKNGDYRLPDYKFMQKNGEEEFVAGIPVNNVFFWKTPLQNGRNVVEVSDGNGHKDRMIVYQATKGETWTSDPNSPILDLRSSNPENPAVFIDRPVEDQGAFYTDVDGTSDNTFDLLPSAARNASWIATRRLSDARQKTDLSFRLNPLSRGATVSVLFSTGQFPKVTLNKPDTAIAGECEAMRKFLSAAGFEPVDTETVWRDHNLKLACAELWSRRCVPGEKVKIPGRVLDYVILLKR